MSNQEDQHEESFIGIFPDTFELVDLNESFAAGSMIGEEEAMFFDYEGPKLVDPFMSATDALKNSKKMNKTKAVKKRKSSASKHQHHQQKDNLKDRPKRALSAYNIFFSSERKKLLANTPVRAIGKPLKSHGKIGFSEMAQRISSKWKSIDPQDKLTTKAWLPRTSGATMSKWVNGPWPNRPRKVHKVPLPSPQLLILWRLILRCLRGCYKSNEKESTSDQKKDFDSPCSASSTQQRLLR
jgi:HMG-box domain